MASYPSTATSTPSSTAPFLEKDEHESTSFLPSSTSSSANHSRTSSLLSPVSTSPPGGWWNAVSRRFAQRNFTRRALVVVMLSAVTLVSIASWVHEQDGLATNGEEQEWYRGLRKSLEEKWQMYGKGTKEKDESGKLRKLDLLKVINFETPQETLQSQLKDGVRYATAMSYGGHANQMISIQKLLYFSKITNRVPIIPSLIPVHIDGGAENMSTFYDLPLFYHLTSLPALEMSQLKSSIPSPGKPSIVQEDFPCWSIQEGTAGFPNREAISFDLHGLFVHHWPLPASGMARGAGGFDLSFDSLRIWDSDVWRKDRWIEKVRNEFLPQKIRKSSEGGEEILDRELPLRDQEGRRKNLKDGFTPRESPAPQDQVVAFDNSLFMGPIMFNPLDLSPPDEPLEPGVPGEGTSWEEIGQHIHFTPLVEDRATSYLLKLFDVKEPSKIPPFITVHLRRGDFAEFTGAGYTDLAKYTSALSRLFPRLQARLDNPQSFSGPSRNSFKPDPKWSHLRASDYEIVATTDEPSSSPFLTEVKALGWKIVDHELFETKETFGGWWPTLLDMAILAKGRAFVGTDRSTYSIMAALRVKYWNGGVTEIA